MKKIANKLVRDNIPDIIRANGGECTVRIMEDNEYRQELIKKMHEEVDEFASDNTAEELADIFEVFIGLVSNSPYDMQEILAITDKKREKNGGFKKKLYMSEYTDNRW